MQGPSQLNLQLQGPSYNHLRDARAAQRLGPDKLLVLDGGRQVAQGSKGQHDGLGDQRRRARDDAQPLDQAHDAVRGGAHVVGRDLAHVGVERARRRADAQEERDLDEHNDHGGGAGEEGMD